MASAGVPARGGVWRASPSGALDRGRACMCLHRQTWPYLLHVNSGESRFVIDQGSGDRDLIAHFAVARAADITIVGKLAVDVFGPVARDELVDYLRDELGWAIESADQRYAVLNACRAVAYAEAGSLLSKVAGGRWWLHGFGSESLGARSPSCAGGRA